MSTQLYAQAKTASAPTPTPAFTPVQPGLLQRKCACGGAPGVDGECEECRAKRLSLQKSGRNVDKPSTVASPSIVHDVLHSHGQSLDATTRAYMEPRFGHDFSKVRVHTDARAAESAQSVNALAYTVGRDVVFGVGQYAPGAREGQRLLAHELTHVVQQGKDSWQCQTRISQPEDVYEQDANQVAEQVTSSSPPDLNRQGSRPAAPAGMILRYRGRGAFNFGRENDPGSGLVEAEFTNTRTQPWIEHITLKFDGTRADTEDPTGTALIATGRLKAVYHANEAAQPDINIPVTGGSTRRGFGLTDQGTGFVVHRIEGVGYNDVPPRDPLPPHRKIGVGPDKKYTRDPHPEMREFTGSASMHYAVFFKGHQAIHAGRLETGSHACIHVPDRTIQRINYHSVEGRTKVDVSYDPGALSRLCCSRMSILGVTRKGDAPNPCRNADPASCPP